MKNPILDAIKSLKAKRVAVIVGDADEMGMSGEMPEEMAAQEEMEPEAEMGMDADDEGDGMPVEKTDAEAVLGRKPFAKKGASMGPEDMDASVAEQAYDEEAVRRMNGRAPKGLFERAQMKIKEKLGK